ncbi:MAG TPA: diguanylate cyclase [Actinomycetota bacterium]|nr:diguanylate cyclase [Actinomycetota bacterium]
MQEITSDRARPLVLVVDDEADLRELARLQLGDGFDVIQAPSGETCIDLALQTVPDVILLDMMMPGMDGAQVLQRLSAAETTKDIPVIFLSALAAAGDRIKGLESGAVDYIPKPVESRELVARVGVAARGRPRHQQGRGDESVGGLPPRAAFEDRLAQEISRSERSSAPLSIMLLDIDGMGELNEQLGRAAAEEVLARAAHVLRNVFRRADGLYRYGADEFAAILPDTDVATSFLAAERCRAALRDVVVGERSISVSIGTAELSAGRSVQDLIGKAEIALFHAKESGGDRAWRADDPRKRSINPIALSAGLTEREWDVLAHLANRRTEQDIGRRMGIRPGTVRSHKARIRRKLHVDPDLRLSEFARMNFRELVTRLEKLNDDDQKPTG